MWEAPYSGPEVDWAPDEVVYLSVRDKGYGTYRGMQNHGDVGWSKLMRGKVPTYYKVISDLDSSNIDNEPDGPKGRLRIAYWWFYGYQQYCHDLECTGKAGEHYGDWERIIVTTDPGRTRPDAVTYFLHGDWYTRPWGTFLAHGVRPVVFVGKLAHGPYHSQEEMGFGDDGTTLHPWHCCEYADWRNHTDDTRWFNVYENLVSLRDTLYWMRADSSQTFWHNGKEYDVLPWRWGTSVPYLAGGCEWEHQDACGTHPTVWPFGWKAPHASCDGAGCQGYRGGCAYSINPDLGWPWDNPAPVLSSAVDGPGESGSSGIVESEPGQVREVSLALKTPNPSAGAWLTGTFSAPRAMDAKLEIYDVRGRLMSTIVNRRVEPGVHMFEWDSGKPPGPRVAPGIYFLRLDTPERIITQKIVIQK